MQSPLPPPPSSVVQEAPKSQTDTLLTPPACGTNAGVRAGPHRLTGIACKNRKVWHAPDFNTPHNSSLHSRVSTLDAEQGTQACTAGGRATFTRAHVAIGSHSTPGTLSVHCDR